MQSLFLAWHPRLVYYQSEKITVAYANYLAHKGSDRLSF